MDSIRNRRFADASDAPTLSPSTHPSVGNSDTPGDTPTDSTFSKHLPVHSGLSSAFTSSRHDVCDLEKAETVPVRPTLEWNNSDRVSRVQSLTRRRRWGDRFSHPLSHQKTGPHVIVDFDGDNDPYRPRNWPMRKKVITTVLYGFTTMGSTFASSVYSPAVDSVSAEFSVGPEVSLLGISLLLAGFGLGPLLWAPISEIYGRKPAVLLPYFVGAIFSFGSGAAKDIQTVLITRFFTGLFASAPVTNTGGVLSDIWDPTQRGTAIVGYALAVVGGPTLGPIVGGAIMESGASWRWTEFATGIYMIITWVIDILVLDETYAPTLLVQKATRLRISTGNWALHAEHEEWDPSIKELAHKFGARPFQMLLTPICFFVALYASFVYGILYGNLASFPIEFQDMRGWNQLVGSLPFLSLLIGIAIGGGLNVLNQQFYNRRFAANGNVPVPEARLPPMMGGSVLFAGGLFLFGWTSSPAYHWILPVVGAGFIGIGFFTIFQGALNYLIDTFQTYSASAIAANTFLRSVFALAFPLFIDPMYRRLGFPWATSVFGLFAVALVPIPFLFYVYGAALRKKGKYSANMG